MSLIRSLETILPEIQAVDSHIVICITLYVGILCKATVFNKLKCNGS